ncbi:MAG: hypothetical protein RLZZ387_411 [Chloroflexota bacterium]|jgi:hypothetical protein
MTYPTARYQPAQIQVGDIIGSTAVAIGHGARASVRIYSGPSYPRPNYRAAIEDLVAHHSQAFVGRVDALAAVMAFAAEPSPGALLIEAPAGFGKSALVARLISAAESGAWDGPAPLLLYYFVRQQGRANTPVAFLQALNGQLLRHLGIDSGVPPDLHSLMSQLSQLWPLATAEASAARPLLLLVDALDEQAGGAATIAEALPAPLTPYAHIVVTARRDTGVSELVGLEHPLREARPLSLGAFDAADVRALLVGLGADTALAGLADEVVALTRGEPLFVRFVCQELATEGERALGRLRRRVPKGVQEYFGQEIARLRAAAKGKLAQDILGMLAVAAGGMTADELAGALGRSSWDVADALGRIRRFLIGRERLALMHLQLRAVVVDLLGAQYDAHRRRLLRWCDSFRKAGWPKETPAYVLLFYPEHLQAEGDPAGLYDLVLDLAFRDRQIAATSDISATLDDVRAALLYALGADDVARAVACAMAYRDTLRRASLALSILQRVEDPDFDETLRHAQLCDRSLGWARVMWLYLAWAAAAAGKTTAADVAIHAALELSAPHADILCDALLAHTARLLHADQPAARAWLADLGRADADRLLVTYDLCPPPNPGERGALLDALGQRLEELEHLAASGAVEAVSMVPFLYTEEVVASQAAGLGTLLLQLAADPAGQAGVDRALDLVLPNPYPRYRDIALVALGVAALAAPDHRWASARLRRILATALDREGVSYTFDLPALLAAECERRGRPDAALGAYLGRGAAAYDRWGTRARAFSAQAVALHRAGREAEAYLAVREAGSADKGYAGYATVTLLALANRWYDLGMPNRGEWPWGLLLGWAEGEAGGVRAVAFREERLRLVAAYRAWAAREDLSDVDAALAELDTMLERDIRLAYVEHLSARWAAAEPPVWEGLRRLVPLALSDGTALDAVLARLVGPRVRALSDADLVVCVESVVTGLAREGLASE